MAEPMDRTDFGLIMCGVIFILLIYILVGASLALAVMPLFAGVPDAPAS